MWGGRGAGSGASTPAPRSQARGGRGGGEGVWRREAGGKPCCGGIVGVGGDSEGVEDMEGELGSMSETPEGR